MGLIRGQQYTDLPVVFKNVKFHRATSLPKEGRVHLIVMVQNGSGKFEVKFYTIIPSIKVEIVGNWTLIHLVWTRLPK